MIRSGFYPPFSNFDYLFDVLGLYIHIPFCKCVCDYCDFMAMAAPERLYKEFTEILILELELFSQKNPEIFSKVETLYLGGGTPSILPLHLLEQIFKSLKELGVPLHTLKEFTMEFNPDSCNEETITLAIKYGLTRASLGLQTFSQELLDLVGRKHTVEQGFKALKTLLSFSNLEISGDLMFNLPNQSVKQFLEDVDTLSDYPINHVSFYGLNVKDNSRLGYRFKKNLIQIDEDLYAPMYRRGVSLLKAKGFERYETSNFARRGAESLHNLNYWNRGEYLAFGPSAHGFFNGIRYHNPDRYILWKKYVQNGAPNSLLDKDFIGKEEAATELIQLSLRTQNGLDLDKLEKMGYKLSEKNISHWIHKGYLEQKNKFITLNNDGWIFMDTVILDLFSTMVDSQNISHF